MTAEITTVFAQNARADDIKTQILTAARQASLHIGSYAVIAGGCHSDEDEAATLRLEATAMEAIAAHAQDVADQLLAWADQVEDARQAAATDGFLDNAEPDVAGADDYLAETSA